LSASNLDVVSAIWGSQPKFGAPITWGIPNVVFNGGGFTGIGDANDGPSQSTTTPANWSTKLSWVHGKHTFGFGGEYNRQNFNQVGNQFSRGVFTFQATATNRKTCAKSINAAATLIRPISCWQEFFVAEGVACALICQGLLSLVDTWKVNTPRENWLPT